MSTTPETTPTAPSPPSSTPTTTTPSSPVAPLTTLTNAAAPLLTAAQNALPPRAQHAANNTAKLATRGINAAVTTMRTDEARNVRDAVFTLANALRAFLVMLFLALLAHVEALFPPPVALSDTSAEQTPPPPSAEGVAPVRRVARLMRRGMDAGARCAVRREKAVRGTREADVYRALRGVGGYARRAVDCALDAMKGYRGVGAPAVAMVVDVCEVLLAEERSGVVVEEVTVEEIREEDDAPVGGDVPKVASDAAAVSS